MFCIGHVWAKCLGHVWAKYRSQSSQEFLALFENGGSQESSSKPARETK